MNQRKSLEALIRTEVLSAKAYHLDDPSSLIKLNQNECPYDRIQILEAFKEDLLKIPINRYPQRENFTLRKVLGEKLGWSDQGILLTNGSNIFVQALILATSVNGKVLTVSPGFSLFRIEAKLLGNEVIEIPLNDDFSLPLDTFLKKMQEQSPHIIFIANPNAPTGNHFKEEALLKIIEAAPCLVVMDEAYYPYSEKTFFPYLEKYNHLVVMRTFSKSAGFAGLRLGYLLGQPEIIEQLEKVLSPFRVSLLSEAVGLIALKNSDRENREIIETRKERERVFQYLVDLKGITPFPSVANFILFRINHPKGATFIYDLLKKEKILIRNFSKEPGIEECLRVSIGLPHENDAFMAKLKKVLDG